MRLIWDGDIPQLLLTKVEIGSRSKALSGQTPGVQALTRPPGDQQSLLRTGEIPARLVGCDELESTWAPEEFAAPGGRGWDTESASVSCLSPAV